MLDSISIVGRQHRPNESSTAALGKACRWVTSHDPTGKTKSTLSNAVHWAYGIFQGGMFGVSGRYVISLNTFGGLIYGTIL